MMVHNLIDSRHNGSYELMLSQWKTVVDATTSGAAICHWHALPGPHHSCPWRMLRGTLWEVVLVPVLRATCWCLEEIRCHDLQQRWPKFSTAIIHEPFYVAILPPSMVPFNNFGANLLYHLQTWNDLDNQQITNHSPHRGASRTNQVPLHSRPAGHRLHGRGAATHCRRWEAPEAPPAKDPQNSKRLVRAGYNNYT